MGLTFTKAPEVAPGDAITSTQYLKLARAFNDRLRSGVGDPTFRIQQYWYNLFRQVRNPAEGGLVFPAQGEFFELYQLLDPEYSQATWPVAGPGEYEGANLGNPMMQFIFGNYTMDSESAMLGEPYFYLRADTLTPHTPYDWWAVGKLQRGAIDFLTNRQCVPAMVGAQRTFQITSGHYSPHGRSYGGFFPTPIELLSSCGSSGTSGEGVPSYELKFSALHAEVDTFGLHGSLSTVAGKPVVTYAGTCPVGSEGLDAGHVIAYGKFFYNHILYVWDGAQPQRVILPVKDWIEGPYTGSEKLSRPDGGQLLRALNAFAADFRGTEEQRADPNFDIESIAFPFQEFLTTQYYLSPAFGLTTGNSGYHCEDVQPFYPIAYYANKLRWSANSEAKFLHDQSSAYRYHEHFVLGGMVAVAQGLAQPVTLEVRDGETIIAILQLTPDAPQTMQWLRDCPTPQDLHVRLISSLEFTDANGWLFIEFTEQLQMLPELWDAYLLLRVMASGGGDASSAGVDGRGRDYGAAKQLGEAYFQLGCAANPQAMSLRDTAEGVNDNPVFDAARRLSRDHMRILARRQFLSYEVAGGKSILRFKRYAYGMSNTRADCFRDIAPPFEPVPSGGLVEGETYLVRTLAPAGVPGSIQYENQTMHHGQRFIAAATREFTVNGIAEVYVYDGIRHRALKGGVTNQWLMFLQTKCYHPSESSIWKPEAYADYFTWNNRCLFYTGSAPYSRSTMAHYTFNVGTTLDDNYRPVLTPPRVQASFIAPEAPSGYNYADGANRQYGTEEFYKSCRVYEPDAEIESSTVEYAHGEEIVVLTFKTRLRACEGAPATVNRNPLAWSEAERNALWSEPYRTPDNALREYVLHQARGDYQCSRKPGDAGLASSVFGLPDNPFGSCYPHFFFTRLVPEPYVDADDEPQSTDTRATVDAFIQMETYLRAMCEGFVDGQTSVQEVCGGGEASLYDYTYENLCFEAFGGRWINGFALSERPDNPAGFGPLPNTIMYAEVFNRLARSVNLLTRVRLGLQWQVQNRIDQYVEVFTPAITTFPGGTGGCNPEHSRAMVTDQAPAATSLTRAFEWTGGAIGAQVFGRIALSCGPDSAFQMETVRQVTHFRVVADPSATGFIHAIPPVLLELVQTHQTGFIAVLTDTRAWSRIKGIVNSSHPDVTRCSGGGEGVPIGPLFHVSDGNYYAHELVTEEQSFCGLFHSGTLDPGTTPPPADYWVLFHPEGICPGGSSRTILLAEVNAVKTGFIAVPLSE